MTNTNHITVDQIWSIPPTAEVAKTGFKLVDAKTGEEITLPSTRKCWDGAEIVVRDFKPSRFAGNQGYIYTTMNETFVPSVCGAKIVQFPVSDAELEDAGSGRGLR